MTGSDEAAQIREDTAPEAQALHQAAAQEVLSGEQEVGQRGEGAGGKTSTPSYVPPTQGSWTLPNKVKGTEKMPSLPLHFQDTKNNSERSPSVICVLLVTLLQASLWLLMGSRRRVVCISI